jgi:hypothetical protein
LTDISIIVLKGHLLVEQLLNSLLSRECHSPGELRPRANQTHLRHRRGESV